MYYRGAAAAIVVYDITNKESFNGAKSWVKELQRRGDPNVIIALAGNKADLQNKRRVETEVLGSFIEFASLHTYRKRNSIPKRTVFYIWKLQQRMRLTSKTYSRRSVRKQIDIRQTIDTYFMQHANYPKIPLNLNETRSQLFRKL